MPSRGPDSVTPVQVNKRQISITWSVIPLKYANGIIIHYKVLYKKEGNGEQVLTNTTKNDVIDLSNLIPYTRYIIQVRANRLCYDIGD